jgi:hypothetical protein
MEANPIFEAFYKELQSKYVKDLADSSEDEDTTVKHIESTYYPHLLKILQRDESVFETPLLFRGVNLSELWKENEESHEAIWKNLLMCLLASFFHGDFKEKIGVILNAVKGMWNGSGQQNDELNRILNDEKSEDYFKEILDYLQNTRIAKVFMEIVEQIDIESLELNFENPQEIVDILKNPEHPKMKKVIGKIQGLIQHKMERGEISQQQIVSEIEGIKAKVQSLFGNVFNDMLGGRRADVPSHVLMGNSPEARRQRMLARLQKKQRDKNSL